MIVGDEVNANFEAVETEVNDNDTRIATNTTSIGVNATGIGTNTSGIGTNDARIAALEATITALAGGLCQIQSTCKTVLATSASYNGNLGGLAGADAKCQALADAPSLIVAGTYIAWLSSCCAAGTDAKDRIPDSEYRRVDGELIATNKADLTDGSILAAIDKDENGNPVSGAVWTGTLSDGTKAPGDFDDFCLLSGSWTSDDGAGFENGLAGSTTVTDGRWTDDGQLRCNQTNRLFCFQQ